ncbi:MAG: hypothetical protein Kow00105_09000 [Phycisphaeraceae bacterium]
MVEGSTAPFAYLVHAFFEPGELNDSSSHSNSARRTAGHDLVVWANRGGGKTMLGAVATLLDMLFKPGIQIRILGGSLEQSSKMYEHLIRLLDRPWFRDLLAGEPTQRRFALINGSRVQLLAGSQRSVRGVRVHKLRCDEVEEFSPEVWDAAQMVTRSGLCGGRMVCGSVEALSTMHRPFGLMARLTDASSSQDESPRHHIFKWTAIDVIERCPPTRLCEGCLLWEDCLGRARYASGFIPVEDLIQQRRRTSHRVWDAEMMCRRPEVSDCVYPEFDPARHVRAVVPEAGTGEWVGGMDFGLRSPTVLLWARVGPVGESNEERVVHVEHEYVHAGRTFTQNLQAIRDQADAVGIPMPTWLGVDPAGNQRNSHSGISDVQALRRAGFQVRSRGSALRDGIERIRRRLDRRTLFIHPRCRQLIRALQAYHFDVSNPHRQEPVKDGPDHLCDALRYLIVNLECGSGRVVERSYL